MTFDIKTFVLSHLIWIVALGAGFIGFQAWKVEHDARIKAEATITASQAQIATLQQSIDARDKASAAQVAPIIKIIHDTVTTPQVVQALPQVVTAPLPAPVLAQSDGSLLLPQADVLPIFQQVADDKVCRLQLDTTQKDLTDTQSIVGQQKNEIAALKKKPSIFKRAITIAKYIGIGIGIGATAVALK